MNPPTFPDRDAYVARRCDVDFWRHHVEHALREHDLFQPAEDILAGHNPTYPTFLHGDVALKLFGHFAPWREAHAAELAAHTLLATDPDIAAPRILAAGRLLEHPDHPWPYLITTRIPGVPLWQAALTPDERRQVAADLGEQIARVHALPPPEASPPKALDPTEAARRSSLPEHLLPQVADFLATLPPPDRTFVHGDLVASHALIHEGRLRGIIDWGDALATDRHYEIGKLFFAGFEGDWALLDAFLHASSWPRESDFPRRALGHTLHRQATGLVQHHSFDVFHTLPGLIPGPPPSSLDELAMQLFHF